jgi:hypothetical protein
MMQHLLAQATNSAPPPAPGPWYAESAYLLTGFLALGVLVAGVIVLVLWRTRMKN